MIQPLATGLVSKASAAARKELAGEAAANSHGDPCL